MRTPRFKRFKKFRKTYHRRFKVRRPRFKNGRFIHYFKRTYKQEVAITNAGFVPITSDGTNYNTFRLDQLPNYSDFTNLYDSYKISGIKRKYIFNRNSVDIASSTQTYHELPFLITCNDWNDSSALGSENEAMEKTTYKSVRLDKPFSRYFKPTTAVVGLADTYIMRRGWVPTTEADKSHLGIKEAVDSYNSVTGVTLGVLNIYTTYYIACRTPR